MREVAGLPVDVDVLSIKTRTAFGESLLQHEPHFSEKSANRLCRKHGAWRFGVDACGPQRLVRIDVADTTDQGLIKQHPLDRTVSATHVRDERRIIEIHIQRIPRDVPNLRWNQIGPIEDEVINCERAESALVGENDGKVSVMGMFDTEPNTLVTFSGRFRCAQQHLSAHPQMRGHCFCPVKKRQPKKLAAAFGSCNFAALKARGEVRCPRGMPSERALVKHRNARDRGTDDGGSESGAYDLDFRKLRHVR